MHYSLLALLPCPLKVPIEEAFNGFLADTSCLSTSLIVLIDEIENAGIDRKRAVHTYKQGRTGQPGSL